jgi:3-oxoacyl-[acyl-carrier protein] reductase
MTADDAVDGLQGLAGLLEGRTALVTGAGGGVGEGIADALGAAGADVVLAVRRLETGDGVAARIRARGGRATAVRCDVGVRDDVEAAIECARREHGGLDLLVHNALAPIGPPDSAVAITDELWAAMLATALRASFFLARAGYADLAAAKGSMVLLVSQQGIEGSHTFPAYAAVKAAQRGFIRSLAREWGPAGVRVNGVAPLGMTPAMEVAYRNNRELEERLKRRVAMRRIGDPALDIGPAVAFLGSDLARYVTGQTLVVDGGGYML